MKRILIALVIALTLAGCFPAEPSSYRDIINTPANQTVVLPQFPQAVSVDVIDDIDSSILGPQEMIVRILYPNDSYITAVLQFNVIDEEPPTIVLVGGDNIIADVNQPWVDPGYVVQDNHSTDPIVEIFLIQEDGSLFTTNATGSYQITYRATDDSGNEAIAVRTVTVADISAPRLIKAEDVLVFVGDTPVEPQLIYKDNLDSNAEISVTYSAEFSNVVLIPGIIDAAVTLQDRSGNSEEYPLTIRVIENPSLLFNRLRLIDVGIIEGDLVEILSEYETYAIFPQSRLKEIRALFLRESNDSLLGGLNFAASLNAYDTVLATSLEVLNIDNAVDVITVLSEAVQFYQTSRGETLSKERLDELIDQLISSQQYIEPADEVALALEFQLERFRIRLHRSQVDLPGIQEYDWFLDRLDALESNLSSSYIDQSNENFLTWISSYENDQTSFYLLRQTLGNQRYELLITSSGNEIQLKAMTDTGFTIVAIRREANIIPLVDGEIRFDIHGDRDQFEVLKVIANGQGSLFLDRNSEIDFEIPITAPKEIELQRFIERLVVLQIRSKRDT